jgi:hypothetical protein|tara:strand:+ start:6020 stop:6715 length:696 start_codon:yes stop_codon:yes gene_type:complete
MGFLDHSTNNIIIDAVLTDTGRRLLANNNGSFRIAFFSLSDDEVDYTTIEKFGRTVGKEKITKNTPVFEAQTKGDLALKHRLLTLPDPTIIRLPTLSIDGTETTDGAVTFTRNATTTRTVNAEQRIDADSRVPDGTSDVTFTILIPDRFLTISGKSPLQIEPNTRVASYNVVRQTTTSANGSKVSFDLRLQPGLDDTTFSVYGDGTTITSVVAIVGDQSGLRKEFQVSISK